MFDKQGDEKQVEHCKNFLYEFDESHEQFQKYLEEKDYSEVATIQGYLFGMISAAQILSNSKTDMDFAKEIIDRLNLLTNT